MNVGLVRPHAPFSHVSQFKQKFDLTFEVLILQSLIFQRWSWIIQANFICYRRKICNMVCKRFPLFARTAKDSMTISQSFDFWCKNMTKKHLVQDRSNSYVLCTWTTTLKNSKTQITSKQTYILLLGHLSRWLGILWCDLIRFLNMYSVYLGM